MEEGQARALVAQLLRRVGETNASWHVFTTVMAAAAMDAAAAADARLGEGRAIGPLDGLAAAVKDNIDVQAEATTAGIAHYKTAIAREDASVVRRLRAAGAVILGKTNLDEGALGVTTDNPWFGRCENPRYPGSTPGGSSGGSAAAVAAGLCSFALGTDTMGSVRIPAACCGIVGFMPTRGALETVGISPLCPGLDTPGLLASTTHDVQAVWQALTGAPRDRRVGGHRLRAGFVPDLLGVAVEEAVGAMIEDALASLGVAGFTSVPLSLSDLDAGRLRSEIFVLCEMEAAELHAQALAADPDGFSPQLRRMLDYGARQKPGRKDGIKGHMERARRLLLDAFAECDFLVLPTTPKGAFPHGTPPPRDMADFTVIANVAGSPAISIPWGRSASGLPLGLQLIGPPGEDLSLLATAVELEQRFSDPTGKPP